MTPVVGLDHVQVAAPKGCEREARSFYGGLLGLPEIEKPEPLHRTMDDIQKQADGYVEWVSRCCMSAGTDTQRSTTFSWVTLQSRLRILRTARLLSSC